MSKEYEWSSIMLRDLKLLIHDIEQGEVYDLEECLDKLKEMIQ